MKQYVIIVAGGKGLRMGKSIPKQFLEINGKAIILHTLEKFTRALPQATLFLVLPENEIPRWQALSKGGIYENILLAKGGETRFESVKAGLSLIEEEGIVGIHDSVRPLVAIHTIQSAFEAAEKHGAAIPLIDLKESIRRMDGTKSTAVDRSSFKLVQTPQCFDSSLIQKAYQQDFQASFTDDASVAEAMGVEISSVQGNTENIKLTTIEDLAVAEVLLSSN